MSEDTKQVQGAGKKGKRWLKRLAVIMLSLAVVVCALGVGVFFYLKRIESNPGEQFGVGTPQVDEYGNLIQQADTTTMNGLVNILLVGLDYSEDRNGWPLKDTYNADVMLVLAVDFNNKKVDMISLPRDSYVDMPNASGIYKLNAAMKCGGGYPSGFPEVLSAAEWMLGGVPVNYYYGVTMPVVKDLVNAINGVDYDLDIDFTLNGRSYTKGPQHMDGQAVLDYFRVRKNVEDPGDLNRINRQKKMLFTIFQKMKKENLWVKLPSLLSSVSNQVVTNCTLGQTAALAAFAYNLDDANISMHSMGGTMASVFNLNFCITDQAARVALLSQVYGTDPNGKAFNQYSDYGYTAVMKKWGSMMYNVYQPNGLTLINYVQGQINSGIVPTPTTTPTPTKTPTPSPTTSSIATPTALLTPDTSSSGTAKSLPKATGTDATYAVYEKFLEVKTLYAKAKNLKGQGKTLVDALDALRTACQQLATLVNHPLKEDSAWKVTYQNQYDVL